MTPLVSSSPRVRSEAEQIETHNLVTRLFLGGARICPRRHRPGAIFSPTGRTGRVQLGRRLQTTRCRPSRRARLSETSPLQQQSTTRWSVQGSFLSHHPTLPRLCSRWPRASRWSDVRGNINSLAGVTADGSAAIRGSTVVVNSDGNNDFTTQPTVLHGPGRRINTNTRQPHLLRFALPGIWQPILITTLLRSSRLRKQSLHGFTAKYMGPGSTRCTTAVPGRPTTSTISWTSSAGSTLTALMTSWMSPAGQHHTDLGGNTLRPAPSTRQLRGDTRRFAISTRSSTWVVR